MTGYAGGVPGRHSKQSKSGQELLAADVAGWRSTALAYIDAHLKTIPSWTLHQVFKRT
jgi:hypothetical protein